MNSYVLWLIKAIIFNILRDGLKSIQRKKDVNTDATEHKYSGNLARLTEKIADNWNDCSAKINDNSVEATTIF